MCYKSIWLSCKVKVLVAQSCLTLLQPHGLQSLRFRYPWNSPGKNTGVGTHSLLQGIFLTQGSNSVYYIAGELFNLLSHQGSKAYCPELLSNAQNYLVYTVQLDSSSLQSFFHYSLSLDWDFPLTWMTNSHLLPQEELSLWEHLSHGGIPSPYSHTSVNHVPLFLAYLSHLAYCSLAYLITNYPPAIVFEPLHKETMLCLCVPWHMLSIQITQQDWAM